MRIWAVSDIHIDYQENNKWLSNLSLADYCEDLLILAGDLSDDLKKLSICFERLNKRFFKVHYVPGNHELWVSSKSRINSLDKFHQVLALAEQYELVIEPFHYNDQSQNISIVPMFSWYDFSFGQPSEKLLNSWVDFRACRWPNNDSVEAISHQFLQKNLPNLTILNQLVISFSHFLPRLDLMPSYIPSDYRYIYPVLGSYKLEEQLRLLQPDIHIYGHSHVNRRVTFEGIEYINNAFGYPSEDRIASKQLLCIYEN